MSKFYFLETIPHGNTGNKLRALPGQTDESGNEINTLLNTQGGSKMRQSYPIGTVYATEALEKNKKNDTEYYSAGKLYPVGISFDKYLNTEDVPSKEIMDAYGEFKNKMTSNPVDEENSQLKNIPIGTLRERLRKKYPRPTIEKDGFFIKESDWQTLLRNIHQKINTMMVGPTGTGKTELVRLAAEKMGISCSIFDMGSMYDPISGMLGVHRLQKGGESVFDYAEFTKAVTKPGIVLLDELSRAPVTTLNILFPCLDSRRTLPVEMAGGNDARSITIHPDCVFIATANVGAEYTGTMSMDRALVGRFFPLELDCMTQADETKVLMKRYGINANNAKNIASTAKNIREMFAKGDISCSVSTRETLMAASMVNDGWSALEAMEMVFLPLYEGSRDGERSIISKVILAN